LSNVYTVLLLVSFLAVVVTLGVVAYVLQTRYGGALGYGEDVAREVDQAGQTLQANQADLEKMDRALLGQPAGAATAPAPPMAPPTAPPLGTADG
jgi:hypothetical protein